MANKEPITNTTYLSPSKQNQFDTNLKSYIKSQSFITPKKLPNITENYHESDHNFENFKQTTVTLKKLS